MITRVSNRPDPGDIRHRHASFYDAVLDAFRTASPPISQHRQLKSPGVRLDKLQNMGDVETAINRIKEQGEGTGQSPFEDDFDANELAHYYRFMQIVVGQKIIKGPDGKAQWDPSQPVPFPEVYPMAMVPRGGYPPDLTKTFNKAFSQVLHFLQLAWDKGGSEGQENLKTSQDIMRDDLSGPAIDLMSKEIQPNSGRGNYGPDFRLV
jgi:hypothetical protein